MFKQRRYRLETEVVLAIMPTVAVIGVLMLLDAFSEQHILFSSLAASAFLIYLYPQHPVNSVRTLVVAQISAAVVGFLVFILLGPGYLAAAIAMIIAITIMVAVDVMHPPAVSSALIFAFKTGTVSTLLLFAFAVVLLVILLALQRASLWIIKKENRRKAAL